MFFSKLTENELGFPRLTVGGKGAINLLAAFLIWSPFFKSNGIGILIPEKKLIDFILLARLNSSYVNIEFPKDYWLQDLRLRRLAVCPY